MSDRLFVTLYLLNGFHKKFVEIKEFEQGARPAIIEWEGMKFKLVGEPTECDVQWDGFDNEVEIDTYKVEPVYMQLKNN